MHFGLTETQEILKRSVREFLAAECPMAEVRRLLETPTASEDGLWRRMAEQGWTGIVFAEEYGGMGLGMVEMAAALEEMGRALLPGPYLSTVLLAGVILEAAGTAEQKRRYLAPICSGEARATLAVFEDAALDAERLTGRKPFVLDAGGANFLVCAARDGAELVLLVMDPRSPGVTIVPTPAIDATRKLYEVRLESAAGEMLARGAAAEAALERAQGVATAGLVAEMVGGMQRVLEISVAYAKTRQQFGKPIGGFQAVQHLCADMLLLTESSRSAAYYAAWALNENTAEAARAVSIAAEAARAVSIAKLYASDAYREVSNRGIQVHGGMGFTWENDIHLYFRRAKASEILFGDATFHRERLAQLVMDRK